MEPKMSMLRIVMSIAITAMLVELVSAATYTVGGPNGGWDTTTDLQTWASSQTFSVGDSLFFQYMSNHDVVEVSKTDYDTCQTTSPISTDNSGSTTILLTSPGKRYLICSLHCSLGMKVEIDALAAPSAPPPAAPQPTTPIAPTVPITSTPKMPSASSPKVSLPPSNLPDRSPTTSTTTESPAISPLPSNNIPLSVPSSAIKVKLIGGFTMGFSYIMMMLLTL